MKSCLNDKPAEVAPEIVLRRGLLPDIYRYVSQFRQTHGSRLETGGMLTGRFNSERAPRFELSGFIGAGPKAECLAESVLFDVEYQSRELARLRAVDGQIGNMGCLHVHPDDMDVCSEGDWRADIAAVRASDTKALVFAIVTINNPRRSPLSLVYRNFKFDFFVLSEEGAFQYRAVRPAVKGRNAGQAVSASNQRGSAKSSCSWWPRLLKDKRRLVAEVRAMEERYGGRATLRLDRNLLYWEYTIVEHGRRFPIQVRYPRNYPFEPPHVISMLPLPASPHQMRGQELCWTNRLWQCEWNPARDTAATCIHAAHRWFACLLVYLSLGKWPAEADDDPRFSA